MPFPAVIDNSIRKAFVSCPTKARYRHIENLIPIADAAIDLHFGGCFARGMELTRKAYWFEAANAVDAINLGVAGANVMWGDYVAPPDHIKQKHRLEGALRFYFEQWPLGEDGFVPEPGGIECQFTFGLPFTHPDTGGPLLYAGRYDLRAFSENGTLFAVDEKTTKRLGDTWYSQWDLDAQMTGYIASIKKGRPTNEIQALVRGVSILSKGAYGHAEVNIIRSDWQIEQWEKQLHRDVARMIDSYKAGEWDLNLSDSCNSYNRPCEYKPLCLTAHPERLIPSEYRVEIWNPLERK
jgi:hypothetical protein